ncbi:MAG: DUF488 domain-containing protein [Phycisphaerales bacterium]|nr:DUF488 domain-containing protein [Phycisphaerales bacterium]
MASIRLKRAYEAAAPDDGRRVLVDRLWPRGVTKERAALAEWAKDAAPSTELRKWFDHDSAKWDEFQHRYRRELEARPAATAELTDRVRRGEPLTLVYSCRDESRNHALVLAAFLRECAAQQTDGAQSPAAKGAGQRSARRG